MFRWETHTGENSPKDVHMTNTQRRFNLYCLREIVYLKVPCCIRRICLLNLIGIQGHSGVLSSITIILWNTLRWCPSIIDLGI